MSFKKGDIISLTEQVDSNWLKGTVHGQMGIFPVNFVKVYYSMLLCYKFELILMKIGFVKLLN